MAQHVSLYSAASTSVNYGGHSFTGLGSGDGVISVERTNPSLTMTIGIQGDGTLHQTTDKSATISITLLAGSETNTFLQAKAGAGDAGIVFSAPLIIESFSNDAKVVANKCVIVTVPTWERGATASEVVWTFLSPDCSITHAGSESI